MVDDINSIVHTEGELMIWILDRINPDYRFTLDFAQDLQENGVKYDNRELVFYWTAVANGRIEVSPESLYKSDE